MVYTYRRMYVCKCASVLQPNAVSNSFLACTLYKVCRYICRYSISRYCRMYVQRFTVLTGEAREVNLVTTRMKPGICSLLQCFCYRAIDGGGDPSLSLQP